MKAESAKILPRITEAARPFWTALREGKFVTTRCQACGEISFPPRLLCPACLSDQREWITLSGRGKIYAFTLNRIVPRGYVPEAPYVTAMVDLEEGPRLLTRLENAAYDQLQIGQAVKVAFKTLTDEITFFYFEPV